MKTKVNKVPLVGPRGKRELLDRVSELEEKITNIQPTEEHILEIVDTVENGSINVALDLLRLDGEVPTFQQLSDTITFDNTVVIVTDSKVKISVLYKSSGLLQIMGGVIFNNNWGTYFNISLFNDDSSDSKVIGGEI